MDSFTARNEECRFRRLLVNTDDDQSSIRSTRVGRDLVGKTWTLAWFILVKNSAFGGEMGKNKFQIKRDGLV